MPLWLLTLIKISAWVGLGIIVISLIIGVIVYKVKKNKDKYE